MKNKVVDYILGVGLIICLIIGILIWFGILYLGIVDCYKVNPNLLYVVIPMVIIVHLYGYFSFRYTKF